MGSENTSVSKAKTLYHPERKIYVSPNEREGSCTSPHQIPHIRAG